MSRITTPAPPQRDPPAEPIPGPIPDRRLRTCEPQRPIRCDSMGRLQVGCQDVCLGSVNAAFIGGVPTLSSDWIIENSGCYTERVFGSRQWWDLPYGASGGGVLRIMDDPACAGWQSSNDLVAYTHAPCEPGSSQKQCNLGIAGPGIVEGLILPWQLDGDEAFAGGRMLLYMRRNCTQHCCDQNSLATYIVQRCACCFNAECSGFIDSFCACREEFDQGENICIECCGDGCEGVCAPFVSDIRANWVRVGSFGVQARAPLSLFAANPAPTLQEYKDGGGALSFIAAVEAPDFARVVGQGDGLQCSCDPPQLRGGGCGAPCSGPCLTTQRLHLDGLTTGDLDSRPIDGGTLVGPDQVVGMTRDGGWSDAQCANQCECEFPGDCCGSSCRCIGCIGLPDLDTRGSVGPAYRVAIEINDLG